MSVKVLHNVEHDGVEYKKGDVIEQITDRQAQALVDSGAAEPTNAKGSGGTQVNRTSRVKENLGKSTANRKTVAEKAQARNTKSNTERAQDAGDPGSAAGTKTPAAKDALPVDNTNAEDGKDNTPDSTDSSNTAGEPGDVSAGDGEGGDEPTEFSLGDDKYTSTVTANGQTQYRKNGGLISKADFTAAQQEANS